MMKKIALDIDGVLLDLINRFCEIFNKRYDSAYREEDIKDWEFFNDWNITEMEFYEIFYEIYQDINLPLIDVDAPKYLRALNKKYDIDLVTARSAQSKILLIKNLKAVGIEKDNHYKNLIMVNPKPYDIKLQYDYDIYIDDNPNLVKGIKFLEQKILLLFDQPWNRKTHSNTNIFRVNSWIEIFQKLR